MPTPAQESGQKPEKYWQFKKGQPKIAGRKKGTANHLTTDVRQMVLGAL